MNFALVSGKSDAYRTRERPHCALPAFSGRNASPSALLDARTQRQKPDSLFKKQEIADRIVGEFFEISIDKASGMNLNFVKIPVGDIYVQKTIVCIAARVAFRFLR